MENGKGRREIFYENWQNAVDFHYPYHLVLLIDVVVSDVIPVEIQKYNKLSQNITKLC